MYLIIYFLSRYSYGSISTHCEIFSLALLLLGGGDNLAVGWECLKHGMALDVIDAKHTVVFTEKVEQSCRLIS